MTLALSLQRGRRLDDRCLAGDVGRFSAKMYSVQFNSSEQPPKNPCGFSRGSLGRLRFRSGLHPCLLPHKKFLYKCHDTWICGCSSSLAFALQGLGPREIARFQLEKISDSSAQDLCGNAFSAPIIFALLVAVLLQYDE